MTSTLESVRTQRDELREQIRLERAKAELKAMKAITEGIDTWYEVPATGAPLATDQPFFAHYPPVPRLYTALSDRLDGRFLPFYENEHDLRRMRARARSLDAFASQAIGAMESLKNYVLGQGITVDVTAKEKGDLDLVTRAKSVIDETLDRNQIIGDLDGESHNTSRVDGDTFFVVYPNEDGTIDLDINDAETCRDPQEHGFVRDLERWLGVEHKLNAWWYGVHTQWNQRKKRMDSARPLGYHFVYDEAGDEWDYQPIARVEHFKRNVPRAAPRGISDYVAVDDDLNAEMKLRRNTASGAAIQAAIAFIRQHAKNTSVDQVQAINAENDDSPLLTFDRSTLGKRTPVTVEKFAPGTVKDIPDGMEYLAGPMGTLNSPVFIEVAGYVLRSIGNRWKFPHYMITGDASNANYASTIVSESPFVKAREDDQAYYRPRFKSLMWKVLYAAWEMGRLGPAPWSVVKATVEITVEMPEVASRDELANAQRNTILKDAGILSKRTWTAEANLDYDEEQENIAKEPKPEPPLMMGGQPGGGFPQTAQRQPVQGVAERLRAASAAIWEGYP